MSDLRKKQEAKPKWLKIKDWLLIGTLVLLVLFIGGLGGRFYYKLNKVEVENERLNNIVDNVSVFFGKHPKEAKTFEEWNN